ncbi:MAG: ribonuclease-3, partial [Kiritimatiellia bacterium]
MSDSWYQGLDRLQTRLGHRFAKSSLLHMALTHRSWSHERGGDNYERLEFLGDAILNAAVTAMLYDRFPDIAEGPLSSQKHNLVCGATLAKIGVELDLPSLMRLGEGARKNRVQDNLAKIEDVTEAVMGAIYLDAGYDRAAAVICQLMEAHVRELQVVTEQQRDAYKNVIQRLHELTQRHPLRTRPTFEVLDRHGAEHAPSFHIGV